MQYYRRATENEDPLSPQYRSYHAGSHYPNAHGIVSHLSIYTTHFPAYDSTWDVNENTLNLYKENDQLPLFHHDHTPAVTRVSEVSGTERGRTHFPLLLAIADNESRRKHNIGLSPSSDLSRHSFRVVNNLIDRGVLDKPSQMPERPTNSITFEKFPEPILYSVSKIPTDEIQAGKEGLRKMLRRPKNLSNQFDEVHEQLKFEGF